MTRRLLILLLLSVTANAFLHFDSRTATRGTIRSTPSLCSLSGFKFHKASGNGEGRLNSKTSTSGCDEVEMYSSDSAGMAAAFMSTPISVRPLRHYIVSMSIRTEDLVALDAFLTAGAYFHIIDKNGYSGAWVPMLGEHGPQSTHGKYTQRTFELQTPSTAGTAVLYLAFSAHTTKYDPDRMTGGRATGHVWLTDVDISEGPAVAVASPSIRIRDDRDIEQAVNQAFLCIHNNQMSSNFTVGAGYTISDNISPDLTFGARGLRRVGVKDYFDNFIPQWQWHAPDATTGKFVAGRVMGQIDWAMGVYEIFSYTGNLDYLKKNLALVDKSLAFVRAQTDSEGLVTLVPLGQGRMGGGADWVDWYKTRLEGRTLQFHIWYAYTLELFASVHTEFAMSFGSSEKAAEYISTARALRSTLVARYWRGDHWLTNADFADEGEWMDDSVWAVYHGFANASAAESLWSRMDSQRGWYEGVPTRWTAFPTQHGGCSWFGRLGAGDILSRARRGGAAGRKAALDLMRSAAETINKLENIYEGYTMDGAVSSGTAGWGDYMEHCSGVIWTISEAFLGISFTPAPTYAMTVDATAFPAEWNHAEHDITIRGIDVTFTWARQSNQSIDVSFIAKSTRSASHAFPPTSIRVVCGDKETVIAATVGGTVTCAQ